jgi:hypothetical protein
MRLGWKTKSIKERIKEHKIQKEWVKIVDEHIKEKEDFIHVCQ